MLELPDYKMPRAKSLAIGLWTRAMIFLKRAGTIILAMMVLIWLLATLPAAAGGRHRARHQLQPRRHDRLGDPAAHRAARLQLADQRGADPRHGGARGRGRLAGHHLLDRRRRGRGRQDRPGARRRTGASARRLRCSPGTCSRRNAPPRSPSSVARPAAGSGCGSPSPTCWRWPMSPRWRPTRSPARSARADETSIGPAAASPSSTPADGPRTIRCPNAAANVSLLAAAAPSLDRPDPAPAAGDDGRDRRGAGLCATTSSTCWARASRRRRPWANGARRPS